MARCGRPLVEGSDAHVISQVYNGGIMEYQQQVIVAGAGPTGLLNALGLAQQGLDVTVVERSREPSDAPRAILYHWSTLDGLERLGLFDDASRAGFLKQDYAHHVRDTGETINYGLKALEGRVTHPYNLHLGQGALATIILRHLEQFPNVRILWGHQIAGLTQDEAAVTITAEHEGNSVQLRAPWLIGADGAGSAVRNALKGIDPVDHTAADLSIRRLDDRRAALGEGRSPKSRDYTRCNSALSKKSATIHFRPPGA